MLQTEFNFDIKTQIWETHSLINRIRNHIRNKGITTEQREIVKAEVTRCINITGDNDVPAIPDNSE